MFEIGTIWALGKYKIQCYYVILCPFLITDDRRKCYHLSLQATPTNLNIQYCLMQFWKFLADSACYLPVQKLMGQEKVELQCCCSLL